MGKEWGRGESEDREGKRALPPADQEELLVSRQPFHLFTAWLEKPLQCLLLPVRCCRPNLPEMRFPLFLAAPANGTCALPPFLHPLSGLWQPWQPGLRPNQIQIGSSHGEQIQLSSSGGSSHQLAYGACVGAETGWIPWREGSVWNIPSSLDLGVFKSGIQSKAPPGLLTLTGVDCDQAEKFPSIFTLAQFPPRTFYTVKGEGLCFYPESDLSPGSSSWVLVQICWSLCCSYRRLHLWTTTFCFHSSHQCSTPSHFWDVLGRIHGSSGSSLLRGFAVLHGGEGGDGSEGWSGNFWISEFLLSLKMEVKEFS